LEQEILPRLAADALARGGSRLRIWSAGCASGEEPYTLALLFAFGERPRDQAPEILATDADSHLIERARRACYPASSLRDLPEPWRAAFERTGDNFCLKPEHRASVRFVEQDIGDAMPAGPFDLILCRNLVFTYFAEPMQREIAGRLAERLVPGGSLLLGTHESLPAPVRGLARKRSWLCRRTTEEGRAANAWCYRG
jgi:chemotaxis protein methyltransferase CheR